MPRPHTQPSTGCATAGNAAYFCDYVLNVLRNDPFALYYRLTDAGRASFISQKSEWTAFTRAVDAILGAEA